MRPRSREEIAAAWGLDIDEVPERGRPKTSDIRFVNTDAIRGVTEYRALEFPAGSGKTWRVDPLDYLTGQRIAELEIKLSAIQAKARVLAKAGENVDAGRAWETQLEFSGFAREAAEFVGPLLIPTHKKGKWCAKLMRRFGHNPLRKATDREVAQVVHFLAGCLMNSQSRVHQVTVRN